jgi:hypothetical protein
MTPRAITTDLSVHELPDEVLVYDPKSEKSHCLNRTAAAVWRACDGTRDVAAIGRAASETMAQVLPSEVVELAMGQLYRRGLIDQGPKARRDDRGLSRREALRYFAAACALPLICTVQAQAQNFLRAKIGDPCGLVTPSAVSICPGESLCCDGQCVDQLNNVNHCGRCGNTCPPLFSCHGGQCL